MTQQISPVYGTKLYSKTTSEIPHGLNLGTLLFLPNFRLPSSNVEILDNKVKIWTLDDKDFQISGTPFDLVDDKIREDYTTICNIAEIGCRKFKKTNSYEVRFYNEHVPTTFEEIKNSLEKKISTNPVEFFIKSMIDFQAQYAKSLVSNTINPKKSQEDVLKDLISNKVNEYISGELILTPQIIYHTIK